MADEPKTAAQLAQEARRPKNLVRVVDLAVNRTATVNRDAVIDPDGNVIDGVQILDDADTVDESGRWLPGEEYTEPTKSTRKAAASSEGSESK